MGGEGKEPKRAKDTNEVSGPVYRRAKRLVAYWRGHDLVVHPYTTGPGYAVDPALVDTLQLFSAWTTADDYAKAAGRRRGAAVRQRLDRLVAAGLLERAHAPVEEPATVWDQWNEAAAFLHFSTRDQRFETAKETRVRLSATALKRPPPPPTKAYLEKPRLRLPSVGERSPLARVVLRRRTWRRFGATQPAVRDLAAVLGLTFRVERWVDLGSFGRVMLRSAPSGGARHPTEAYVLVRSVKGLAPGAYYYAPDEHALVRLRAKRVSDAEITRLLVGQHWYADAPVLVFMTSVFERTAWVYRSAGVYKSLLLEAGHFCQTFCLAATERNLAPFCTAAFAASPIERLLGLDGTHESVMYVTGFGTRPRGVSWAPLPEGEGDLPA